jgi:hypothetical protein
VNLNPEDRKHWQGFLDLLQPPPGYRLAAALGTTFGLSMEALVAALLSMCDADGEELASNPVAATMAITRMSPKMRVLVHPATITGPSANAGSNRFVALLDRLVVEVQPTSGLFHPKVWAMRFEHIGAPKGGKPAELGRVLVGSRNLTGSTCFELGAMFEGTVADEGDDGSELGGDVARALREWLTATKVRYPEAVWRLPRFIGRLAFDVPHEANASLRLRWQGGGRMPLADALPNRLQRAVVVAPFIQPEFVTHVLSRTETLHIVSIPESLDALPDESIAALDARAAAQGSPALYQVTHHGNPDDSYIDGIHAKLLLTEGPRQHQATFVGSANATGPGWGLGGAANVEAMVEMRPGIDIDRFVAGFIRESKTKIHPWVSEYDRSARPEPDQEKEAERHMLAALREVAKTELIVHYEAKRQRLTISRASRKSGLPSWVSAGGLKFSLSPLLLAGSVGAWRPISEVDGGGCHFDEVPVAKLSAFVALRAQSRTPPLERQRFVVAKLEVDDALLEERDRTLRADILATADPAMVLNALVRGLAHVRSATPGVVGRATTANRGLHALLADTTLERLLQAVALDPALVTEMRLLLGPLHGEALLKLCDDLEEVMRRVYTEATP